MGQDATLTGEIPKVWRFYFFRTKEHFRKLMDNEHKTLGFDAPGAGQPPASKVEPGATIPDLKRLHPDDVTAIANAVLEGQRRAEQSRRDKLEAAKKKQVATVRAAGVELTPDQERILAANVTIDDEPLPAQPSPAQPAPVAKTELNAPAVSWKTESYMAIVEDLPPDQWLAEDDPEYRGLPATEDPGEFRKAIKKAIQDKKARLASGALGRLPAVPAGGKPSDLKAQFQKEMSELPRGDVDARGRLYAKYKALGFTDFS